VTANNPMPSKLFVAISSDFGFSYLFTDVGSKAYAAAIEFLLYSVTL